MANEVLVVVPTIFRHRARGRLFDRICQDPEVRTLLVVDNGNSFGIPPQKQADWAKIEYHNPGTNLNWLRSNNLGIKMAVDRDIPYVCFMNDDLFLSGPGFFSGLLETLRARRRAGLVVPRYTGHFGDKAHCAASPGAWRPHASETSVSWVDGTCMLMPTTTLTTVGPLDPIFRDPGWGADVDFSHRVHLAGMEIFVSNRAKVWHANGHGGRSAKRVYGGRRNWIAKGLRQAKEDLERKYGPRWRDILPLPPNAYNPE